MVRPSLNEFQRMASLICSNWSTRCVALLGSWRWRCQHRPVRIRGWRNPTRSLRGKPCRDRCGVQSSRHILRDDRYTIDVDRHRLCRSPWRGCRVWTIRLNVASGDAYEVCPTATQIIAPITEFTVSRVVATPFIEPRAALALTVAAALPAGSVRWLKRRKPAIG